jgi:hypothetical protein
MGKADRYIERWRSRKCVLNPMENRPVDTGFIGSMRQWDQFRKVSAGNSKLMNDLLKSKKRK